MFLFSGHFVSLHQGASGGLSVHSLGGRRMQRRRLPPKKTGEYHPPAVLTCNTVCRFLLSRPAFQAPPSVTTSACRLKRTWSRTEHARSTSWTRRSTRMRRRPSRRWWRTCCGRWRRTGRARRSSSSRVTCGGRRTLLGESKASKYASSPSPVQIHSSVSSERQRLTSCSSKQNLSRRGSFHQEVARTRPKGLHLLLWKCGGAKASLQILSGGRCCRSKPLCWHLHGFECSFLHHLTFFFVSYSTVTLTPR